MATLRVAVVSYHMEELIVGKGNDSMSIGTMVDNFINAELRDGNLIQSVNLEFDENEQHQLRAQSADSVLNKYAGEAVPYDVDAKPTRRR